MTIIKEFPLREWSDKRFECWECGDRGPWRTTLTVAHSDESWHQTMTGHDVEEPRVQV